MNFRVNKKDLKPGTKLRHLRSSSVATVVSDKERPSRLVRTHRDYVKVTRHQQPGGRKWIGTWSLHLVEIV